MTGGGSSARPTRRPQATVRGLATIVLAAGQGSRYGAAKQLAPVAGRPMLGRVLEALDGFGWPQLVVIGAHADQVRPALPTGAWEAVLAADWERGPGASLRAGLMAAPEAEAALIVLGDLPYLRREAVERLLACAARRRESALRAFDRDTPGHPVLVRGLALVRAREAPDTGLGSLLSELSAIPVACEGLGVAADVDVSADIGLTRPRR